MNDHQEPGPTPRSMIAGLRQGDKKEWERFTLIYADWLRESAARKLKREHKDRADDVAQSIILGLLRQSDNRAFTYDPDLSRFRGYLATCVRHEVWAISNQGNATRSAIEPEPAFDPLATTADDHDLDPELLLKLLKGVLLQVRADAHAANPLPWQCFEERLFRNRPAAEIAAAHGINRELVYQNVHRILDKIDHVFVAKYQQQFPNLKPAPDFKDRLINAESLKDICGDLLADELKTAGTLKSEAVVYFRGVLRDTAAGLEREARELGPSHWPAFRSYTRAVALDQDAPEPTPEVERLLRKVDRLFRHRCSGDHAGLKLYHHFRLTRDNAGIDPDAVARLCGEFFEEGADDDD